MGEWISVEDKLPEVGQTVAFTAGKNKLVYVGKYTRIGTGKPFFEYNLYKDDYWGKGAEPMMCLIVHHWMPLPEPPKEQE